MSMQFVFFGTPEPAVEILEILHAKGLTPALIVTNPDKPWGRSLKLSPPPVKLWAQENKVDFLQPEKLDSVFHQQLTTYNPQLFMVVAYGAILPKHILDIPKRGSLNVHYSLLPKYRGASPVESQILADDKEAGVSILLLDEEMDHGPIVAQKDLLPTTNNRLLWPPTATELRKVMNQEAGELLAEILPDWIAGNIEAKPQDHSKATYTKKFTKSDGEIDLSGDPYKNFLKIQAFEGSIGTYFFYYTEATRTKNTERDGTIPSQFRVGGVPRRLRVLIKSAEFRDGKLVITRVVPEGKKEMRYEEFLRGLH